MPKGQTIVILGGGDFYAEPMPAVRIHAPSRRWHIGKVLFEQHWLRRVL